MLSLRRELFKCSVGESIILTVVSGNEEKEVEVIVGNMEKSYQGENQ